MKRTLITFLIVCVGIALVMVSLRDTSPIKSGDEAVEQDVASAVVVGEDVTPTAVVVEEKEPLDQDHDEVDLTSELPEVNTGDDTVIEESEPRVIVESPGEVSAVSMLPKLKVVDPGRQMEPVIGSCEKPTEPDNEYLLQVRVSPFGAGVSEMKLADYSTKVYEHIPYTIQNKLLWEKGARGSYYYYPFGATHITINGQSLDLKYSRWRLMTNANAAKNDGMATFELRIVESESEKDVLTIRRTYRVMQGRYDVILEQKLLNLSGKALNVRFSQFGPGDLISEGTYIGDRRKVKFGYFRPDYDISRTHVYSGEMDVDRSKIVEKKSGESLWPNELTSEETYELVWVAAANRYFATAVHGVVDVPIRGETVKRVGDLDGTFVAVGSYIFDTEERDMHGELVKGMLVTLNGKEVKLGVGGSADMDMAIFAGPMDPRMLKADPVYHALGLEGLVVYLLSACCSIMTFAWLADFLIAFLRLIELGVRDWGIAIVVLVVVVRVILHPIMKRGQVNMSKVGKQMQAVKPDIDRLKKKYKDNSQKLQAETAKLYKEKGINPMAMGFGCLPMLLQTPIWIALYAMLYFAIELRHEPAFYDVFHIIGGLFGHEWVFLSDMSTADNFIRLGKLSFTIPLAGWKVDSINLLPILMAGVFYIQQKFTMQHQPAMNEQAAQQQKIMKWMVLLFPVMLYKAPSGLNLYILTSTAMGIVDSYFVRKHLKEMEANGTLFNSKPGKAGGIMSRMHKAMEEQQRRLDGKKKGGSGRK